MRRALLFPTLAVLALVACSSKEEEVGGRGTKEPCGAAPVALSTPPALPIDFPKPSAVTYTSAEQAGPSLIVGGHHTGDLGEAFDDYKASFSGQTTFEVTKDEREEDDAEVFFASASSTGQVKLEAECEGRTEVRITLRPA